MKGPITSFPFFFVFSKYFAANFKHRGRLPKHSLCKFKMTSTVEIVDDENDDGFDWEAAVREIDVACQNAGTSSSSIGVESKKHSGGGKQSTLDKFLGKVWPSRNGTVEDLLDVAHIDADGDDSSVPVISIDPEAAKSWIYPANVPVRDYQFDITKTALFSNTLVALPTGLGKTLIAAVVMYNFFRWFPEGKIVFAAPSRPLVMQQIEACHNIVGIPQEWTIDMTGQTNPAKRADFWKTKRVFFVTPQVLERDIQSGTCLAKYLVCLVIDEAHRASGNYSYCVAVRQLMSIPVQLRILALTATPGSKQQAIQHIIDNLHISTLEYRNESDPDVSKYVHNRKIELIQVALGKDTVDVNEKLLAVIRPYVTKLSAFGLLQNRDYRTLSPPDLLNSRDKFRRAPPQVLESKRGEIEACFAGLITLYHIRKLLTSHGIRPAYEMLEEKLKQGPFARLMSKNEEIWKIKLLMQRNLSHGAPSPKLSKMLEILVDHFKTMDPGKSRVIIFSNFRGSVRDIMDALASIGDVVKATEFIGQSSGKALKGQSQKVQQAVLQKFRAGGYNVIVATSIGEEGLDIMEVDLVICFDANVSPLRMIQRMGRTGRKNDGRVVVLACEGSELKGYMRKQATGRNIRKHMHNGGISSFSFHSSPRMIPHIFKPEAKIVEMSIEQYVPRGKKAKDNDAVETPVVKQKLTAAESTLLAKYFQPTTGTWRPSLIAFPHSQEFPSRVHKVMHSCRTDMLIDMMQNLHSFGSLKSCGPFSIEDEVSSGTCFETDTREKENVNDQGSSGPSYSPVSMPQEKLNSFEKSPLKTLAAKKPMVLNKDGHVPPSHSYLFGSDFVSVDPQGKVQILFVPSFPSKVESHSESRGVCATMPEGSLKQNSSCSRAAGIDYRNLTMHRKDSISPGCFKNVYLTPNKLSNSRVQEVETDHQVEIPSKERNCTTNMVTEQLCLGEAFEDLRVKVPSPQVNSLQINESSALLIDNELSPRLTMLIHSGIVPESPCESGGSLTRGNESPTHEPVSPENVRTLRVPASPGLQTNQAPVHINSCQRQISSPTDYDVQTPLTRVTNLTKPGRFTVISPPSELAESPMANLTRSNTSKDWVLSSEDKSDIGKVRKLKRLRKLGDALAPAVGSSSSFSDRILDGMKNTKGKKKPAQNIRAFIEEEAEVSSEAEIADDEEDEPLNSSYDDSFIDDRASPTAATTQGEDGRVDMMAVYRRSLLTPSPLLKESSSTSISPDSVHPVSRSPSVNALNPLKSPQNESVNQSTGFSLACSRMNPNRITATMPSTATDNPIERDTITETKRRKLSCQTESIPVINLEQQFALQADNVVQEPLQPSAAGGYTADDDMLCDDQFFASIDFDAVEAQATSFLKQRQESFLGKQDLASNSSIQLNVNLQTSPSFNLGIE